MSHIDVPKLGTNIDYVSKNSYGMLAEAPEADRAVIFFHGFGGHPFKTWARMQDLIRSDDDWKGTDAFFIGYDSVTDDIMLSARYVSNIIGQIFPKPPGALFRASVGRMHYQLRPDGTSYKSLDLVGHSLGGVVLRQAVLLLLKQGLDAGGSPHLADIPNSYSAPCSARVLLFAPAQGGVRIAGIAGVLGSIPPFKQFVKIIRGGSPSFQELEAGSQVIQSLREDTTHFAEMYPTLRSLRARTVWAHNDRIVTSLDFRHDTSFTILGTHHQSVCKSSPKFRASFVFVSTGTLTQKDGTL
ncbi:esterase/lipase family protein [Embleya sp. NPDC008237]|uniref:esterase/lipase family protein n=1 Tax=Embleya sp. NPDC008237 TaxID=3363978 RepID=UPI0036E3B8D3